MTTERLLEIVASLGLSIELGPDEQPMLRGPKERRSRRLLRVLVIHREPILSRLKSAKAQQDRQAELATGPRVECRWANGTVCRHWFPESGWPVGAREWRHVGTATWHPIPEDERPQRPAGGWTGQWPGSYVQVSRTGQRLSSEDDQSFFGRGDTKDADAGVQDAAD